MRKLINPLIQVGTTILFLKKGIMVKTLVRLSTLAFVLALTSSLTRADPVIITSGFLSVSGLAGIPSYSFSGANFSATGSGNDFGNVGPECFPCVSGNIINTNSTFGGSTLGRATVTINGTTFTNIFLGGVLMFTGPSIIIPVTDSTSLTLTAPFTLSGSLFGCLESQLSCETIVFSTQVSGSGLATIRYQGFIDSQGRILFDFRNVTYTFQDATIPEPGSMLLLTSGVAALVAAKLRTGKRRTKGP